MWRRVPPAILTLLNAAQKGWSPAPRTIRARKPSVLFLTFPPLRMLSSNKNSPPCYSKASRTTSCPRNRGRIPESCSPNVEMDTRQFFRSWDQAARSHPGSRRNTRRCGPCRFPSHMGKNPLLRATSYSLKVSVLGSKRPIFPFWNSPNQTVPSESTAILRSYEFWVGGIHCVTFKVLESIFPI